MTATKTMKKEKKQYPRINPANLRDGVFMVGPAQATKILNERNKRNRPISSGHVEFLADQMKQGWVVTQNGLAIDEDGNIINGQHTLLAVALSGIEIPLRVTIDLPREAFDVIDTNRRRMGGDVLAMAGYKYASLAASICRIEVAYQRRGQSLGKIAPRDVTSIAGKMPNLEEVCQMSMVAYMNSGKLFPPSALGWVLTRALKQDRTMAELFVEGITIGVDLSAQDPRLAARRRLQTGFKQTGGLQYQQKCIWVLWRAWELFRDGEKVTKIPLPKDGQLWPEIG